MSPLQHIGITGSGFPENLVYSSPGGCSFHRRKADAVLKTREAKKDDHRRPESAPGRFMFQSPETCPERLDLPPEPAFRVGGGLGARGLGGQRRGPRVQLLPRLFPVLRAQRLL